jgi:cytochrome c oxidase subunit 4
MAKESNQAVNNKPAGAMKHIVSFVLMIAFTMASFFIVMRDVVPSGWVLPLLLVFAVIQVFLQLFTFMHLDQKGSSYYTLFMLFGIFVAVISAVGIIVL